jgi:serine/threonine-protein kinase
MHSRGVVHRDLKPDNLLVSLDDQRVQPKILDFGIAKLNDAGCESRLDDPGTLIGSPEYMSPEQAAACPDVDFRTDIWSICVVLYEALSGETPFQATNQLVLLHAIIADEPASLVRRGVADETLWSIVRSGLSKDRTERPASMHELGRALARWLLDHGVREDVCGTSLESKWLARDDTSIAVARSEVHMPAAGPRRATDLVQTTRPVRARSSKRTRANTRDATRTTKGRSPRVFAALLAVFTTVALAALQRHGFDPAMVASRIETSSRSAWARLQSESVRRDFPAFRSVLPRSWRGGVGR